jgi:malonyl CoA-acyl carrier protein transacylase
LHVSQNGILLVSASERERERERERGGGDSHGTVFDAGDNFGSKLSRVSRCPSEIPVVETYDAKFRTRKQKRRSKKRFYFE